MKSIIIGSIFTLFIACISFAQPIKGTSVLGGSGSFSFSNTPSESYKSQRTYFGISPSFGKFVSEKFLLEGGLAYSRSRVDLINQTESGNFTKLTNHSLSIRFGTTRFFSIADKLYFTLRAAIIPGYEISRSESEYLGVEAISESNNISAKLTVSPGLAYFINEKWMLYSYIGRLSYEITYGTSSKLVGHTFYVNASANSFGLGVRYILGAKTKSN